MPGRGSFSGVATGPSAYPSACLSTAASTSTMRKNTNSAGRNFWNRTFSNGDAYRGEALHVFDTTRKPVQDGTGQYTWAASGAVYDGAWKGGRPEGDGVMTLPGRGGYCYTGAFVAGLRSGKGQCSFANGRTYDGEWLEDEMCGQGTMHGAAKVDDFVEYVGGFEHGKRSGPHGRCVYVNGDVYEGPWRDGRRHGVGEWCMQRVGGANASAPVSYRGAFVDDVPHANAEEEGELTYADGSTYVGGVDAQLRRSGRGVYRGADGAVHEGLFAHDEHEGRGTWRDEEGTVCEGTWLRGQLEGTVHVSFPAAAAVRGVASADARQLLRLYQSAHRILIYEGPCAGGVFTGASASINYADGSSYHGAVRDGVPHGAGLLRDLALPCATGASASSAEWGAALRQRLPAARVSAAVVVTLLSYDGSFLHGEADGTGIGRWQFQLTTSATPSSSSPPPPLRPSTSPKRVDAASFTERLASGLRWWEAALVDGTYTGAWQRGLPHGQGKWDWVDGSSYTGAVANLLPLGNGAYTGDCVCYTGGFSEGVPGGTGRMEDTAQGFVYDGRWSAGRPHGAGRCTLETHGLSSSSSQLPSPHAGDICAGLCATVYDGNWTNGKPNGQGRTYVAPDLQRVVYDGNYVDGYRDGEGTLFFGSLHRSNTKEEAVLSFVQVYAQYTGTFSHGHPGGGHGCLTLRNNATVEGSFDSILRPCSGTTITVRLPNGGGSFTGVLDGDTRTGRGTLQFPNGDVYEGEVEDGDGMASAPAPLLYSLQRHGHGVFRFAEGNQLTCKWRHNILHGTGVYKTADGTQSERNYVEGVLTNEGAAATANTSANVFTPENEFPNTLSEETLKTRIADAQTSLITTATIPSLSNQQQQQARPFAFVRRGEARQVSTAGNPANTSATAPLSPSSHRIAPAIARRVSTEHAQSRPRSNSPSPAAATESPRTQRISVRNRDGQDGSGRGSSPSPTSRSLSVSERGTPRHAIGGHSSASTDPRNSPVTSNSAYGRHRQTSVRLAEGSPLVPLAKTETVTNTSVRSTTPRKVSNSSGLPVTASAASAPRGGPVRRRLSSALAVGRGQQQQRQAPGSPLQGPLKELMAKASAIRSTREDQIHLLTEEMRQLNERIWQLRYVLQHPRETTEKEKDVSAVVTSPGAAALSARRQRRRSHGSEGGAHGDGATNAQQLDSLIQERRVVMEKLQYVVNAPE